MSSTEPSLKAFIARETPSHHWVSKLWLLGPLFISLLLLVPFVALAWLAAKGFFTAHTNVFTHHLLDSAITTLWLLLGVGILTFLIGVSTAWILTLYQFKGSKYLSWGLLLPLAVPAYISAYAYVELLDYSGPIQNFIRTTWGYQSVKDYWFPSITTLQGAIFIISFVLYPYVYIAARSSFLMQSLCTLEAARTLGATPWQAFRRVALPLARPAIVAGLSLALMETMNDIGVVEYFGVKTLTIEVYTTWLERSDLAGAAQISMMMLLFIFALLLIEQALRRKAKYHQSTLRYQELTPVRLKGGKAIAAFMLCALPILIGFMLPVVQILINAVNHFDSNFTPAFLSAAMNSLTLSTLTAFLVLVIGFLLVFYHYTLGHKWLKFTTRLGGMGYALPGTVLGVGLLIPLTGLDNWIDGISRDYFGTSTGLLFTGTMCALLYAYCVRFMGISLGTITSGFAKLSPNIGAAARTLGASNIRTMWQIYLPMVKTALGAGALLVFVDCMKELPATLLLRPFNFDTLATHIYALADLAQFNEAGLAALCVVLIGLVPLLILHRTLLTGRPGHETVE